MPDFSIHTLWDHPDMIREVKKPVDYPKGAHFQIHVLEEVRPYSGWEAESGPSNPQVYWRIFACPGGATNKALWSQLVMAYYADIHKPKGRSFSEPMQLLAFEVTTTVEPVMHLRNT